MKNLTYMERKMLVYNHVRDGYTYKEAYEMVKNDCDSIRNLNKKRKRKRRKSFKENWSELVSKPISGC
jgi:transposase